MKIGDASPTPYSRRSLSPTGSIAYKLVGLDLVYCVTRHGARRAQPRIHVTVLTDAVALQNDEKRDAMLKEYRTRRAALSKARPSGGERRASAKDPTHFR
jgi:hypothetical protein